MAPPNGPQSMAARQTLHQSSHSTLSSASSRSPSQRQQHQQQHPPPLPHSSSSSSSGRRHSAGNGDGDKKTLLRSFKTWLSVSEPSAQAMKTQKRDAFRRAGIDPKDPAAAAKMHLPLGTLPLGATTSTSGPTPEERLARERRSRPQCRTHGSAQSVSSGSSTSAPPSIRDVNHVAPWEN
ncbi:hypothetical protein BBO_02221 [Beauveria brongniartii RCEF 3172]|uniref:Uncharacterized protein n=1 Tax=Beauveria brongniartii RCEF 3172 TaxID=1081107 RepID=A0A167IJZ6_9HYPO|nr:hypothetical protein BBO_02221 [Beauveria brongniartii RCEF 3172]